MFTKIVSYVTNMEKWVKLLAMTIGVVTFLGTASWSVLTYAMDQEYVKLEDMEDFSIEFDKKIEQLDNNNRQLIKETASSIECTMIKQRISELSSQIRYKQQEQQDYSLQQFQLDEQNLNLSLREDCKIR